MLEIYGMDWCGTCQATRRHLTAIDVPFTYHHLPPGEAGWKKVEELSGRRATPVIINNGRNMPWPEFKAWIDSLGRTPRALTQEERDELDG